jgi:hypothetical protein
MTSLYSLRLVFSEFHKFVFVTESVDLLLDFMECSQGKPAEISTLIIRNLCCHSSNKPKLLANGKIINIFY